ncbi:hypothetical protein MMA231_02886 [Asticcacaulis sp. MM231]
MGGDIFVYPPLQSGNFVVREGVEQAKRAGLVSLTEGASFRMMKDSQKPHHHIRIGDPIGLRPRAVPLPIKAGEV